MAERTLEYDTATKRVHLVGAVSGYTHPNHTGDVTSVGDGAQTIAAGAVTNAKRAGMPAWTLSGNNSASNAAPQDIAVGDLSQITTPASGDMLFGFRAGAFGWVDWDDLPMGGGGGGDFMADGSVDMTGRFRAANGSISLPGISFAAGTGFGFTLSGSEMYVSGDGTLLQIMTSAATEFRKPIKMTAGSASAPGYSFTTATSLGMHKSGGTGGTQVTFKTSAGSVTTDTAFSTPGGGTVSALLLDATRAGTNGTFYPNKLILASPGTVGDPGFLMEDDVGWFADVSGTDRISACLRVGGTMTEVFAVTADKKVGVGSTSPVGHIHVIPDATNIGYTTEGASTAGGTPDACFAYRGSGVLHFRLGRLDASWTNFVEQLKIDGSTDAATFEGGVGSYGVTPPTTQPAHISDPTDLAECISAVEDILTVLENKGDIASS